MRAMADERARGTGDGATGEPAGGAAPPGWAVQEAERLTRGAVQVLPEGGLAVALARARAASRPLVVKLGIDPTGSDLTLGHAVVLRALRRFQDAGHTAVLVVGDVTGMVGDPSGRSATRSALSLEDTTRNSAGWFAQAGLVLDLPRAVVRRNSEWLSALTFPDVLREARHLTVAQLLEREDFGTRYRAGQPLSLSELLYPLMQGYDSVALEADVELGGTDQTYNLLVGRELQRAHGQEPQTVVTLPLLEGLDGAAKMGKSLGNWVGVAEPPDEQFGKLMSLPDPLVGRYLRLCTDLPEPEVAEVEARAAAGGPAAAQAKRALAQAVVRQYAGDEAAAAASARFDRVFRDREVPQDVPEHPLAPGEGLVHLPAVLVEAGLAPSRSAARRSLQDGAVRLDGQATTELDVAREAVLGRVLALGRRRSVRLVAVDAP